jgi:hypothetical protein
VDEAGVSMSLGSRLDRGRVPGSRFDAEIAQIPDCLVEDQPRQQTRLNPIWAIGTRRSAAESSRQLIWRNP